MEPIVHGLNEEFAGRMAFERRNAAEEAGQQSMDRYGLRGHPSYAIVASNGEALWAQLGPSDEGRLRTAMQQFAASTAPGD